MCSAATLSASEASSMLLWCEQFYVFGVYNFRYLQPLNIMYEIIRKRRICWKHFRRNVTWPDRLHWRWFYAHKETLFLMYKKRRIPLSLFMAVHPNSEHLLWRFCIQCQLKSSTIGLSACPWKKNALSAFNKWNWIRYTHTGTWTSFSFRSVHWYGTEQHQSELHLIIQNIYICCPYMRNAINVWDLSRHIKWFSLLYVFYLLLLLRVFFFYLFLWVHDIRLFFLYKHQHHVILHIWQTYGATLIL